jgi:hypothetical protein
LFKVADQNGPSDVRAMADVEGAGLWAKAGRCSTVARRMDRRLPELGGALRVKALDAMSRCRKDTRTLAAIERAAEANGPLQSQLDPSTRRVANGLTLEQLAHAIEQFGKGPLGPTLRERLQARAQAAGRADLVAVARGQAVESQQASKTGNPAPGQHLAVLLPLSGRSQRLGARLEQLVTALYGGEDRPTGAPQVTVHDIGTGSIDTIIESVAGHSVAAVGLFDRKTARPAAAAAARLKLPLLMLTTSDAAVETQGPVWRTLHTPLLVARTAAGAALGRGGKKAAILYQEGGYGRTLGRWFGEAWRAGGGQLAGTLVWKKGEKNFSRLAKKARRLKVDTYFIPTQPAVAARLLSHLAAEKVFARRPPKKAKKGKRSTDDARYVVIVGPPEWYDPTLLRQGGRYAEGVLVPVPFALETAGGADLEDRLGARLGRSPGVFDGLLAEALRALQLAATRAAEDELPITDVLRSMHLDNGYTAGLHFDSPEALQALFLMEVVRGVFEPSQ